jgi:hypothetical protein
MSRKQLVTAVLLLAALFIPLGHASAHGGWGHGGWHHGWGWGWGGYGYPVAYGYYAPYSYGYYAPYSYDYYAAPVSYGYYARPVYHHAVHRRVAYTTYRQCCCMCN